MENKNTKLKTKISERMVSDIKLRLSSQSLPIRMESVTYCFILRFTLRDTWRYTTLPGVKPQHLAIPCCIKFSSLNAKKEGNLTSRIIQNFTRGKNVKQVQDMAKSSGNRVEKSFIYK